MFKIFSISLLCAISAASALAVDPVGDVRVVVDMTAAGRRARQPTPHHPVIYYPVVAPYTEEGQAYAFDQPPPPKQVTEHLLAVALAKQGYLYVDGATPDILLVVVFGSINPQIGTMTGRGRAKGRTIGLAVNRAEMIAMLAGDDVTQMDIPAVRDAVLNEVKLPHYFMMVTAVTYQKPHQELWRARITVPGVHVYFGDVVQALITKGVPFFGKDTRPTLIPLPIGQGHVEVGKPTVKE
jgi:hypothetical protein